MIVLTTDSLAATVSVDKGYCFEKISLVVLHNILGLCDEKRILLATLWEAREILIS